MTTWSTLPRGDAASAAAAPEPLRDAVAALLGTARAFADGTAGTPARAVAARLDVPSALPAQPRCAHRSAAAWADGVAAIARVARRLLFITMALIGTGVTIMQLADHPARPTLQPAPLAPAATAAYPPAHAR